MSQMRAVIFIFLASFTSNFVQSKDTYSQISDGSFSDIQCVPYAYGDFNADKRVDIFCVSKSGTQVEIWLAQEKEPLFSQHKVFTLKLAKFFLFMFHQNFFFFNSAI